MKNSDPPGQGPQILHRRIEELEQQVNRLREQLEAAEALQQTALNVTSHLEMPQLLETIVRRASSLLNATGGVVYLHPTPDSPLVEAVVSYNLDRDALAAETRRPLSHRRWR